MVIKKQSFEELLQTLADTVKKLRKQKGLTQENMRDYGFNYRHYQKLESGKASPSLSTLYKIAKTFDVEIKDLF